MHDMNLQTQRGENGDTDPLGGAMQYIYCFEVNSEIRKYEAIAHCSTSI